MEQQQVTVALNTRSFSPVNTPPLTLPSTSDSNKTSDSQATRLSRLITKKDAKGDGRLVLNPLPFTRRVQVSGEGISHLPHRRAACLRRRRRHREARSHHRCPADGLCLDRPRSRRGKNPIAANRSSSKRPRSATSSSKPTSAPRQAHSSLSSKRANAPTAFRSNSPSARPGKTPLETDSHHARRDEPVYSRMIGDSLEITESSPLAGAITTKGRLVDDEGKDVARFTQHYRLTARQSHRRSPHHARPDRHAHCRRLESLLLRPLRLESRSRRMTRGLHDTKQITRSKRFESPQYIEIGDVATKSTIFCGGLAFHQRFGPRMLDTLLIVKGETAREFRLGMGLDVAYPAHEGRTLHRAACVTPVFTPPPQRRNLRLALFTSMPATYSSPPSSRSSTAASAPAHRSEFRNPRPRRRSRPSAASANSKPPTASRRLRRIERLRHQRGQNPGTTRPRTMDGSHRLVVASFPIT